MFRKWIVPTDADPGGSKNAISHMFPIIFENTNQHMFLNTLNNDLKVYKNT